VAGNGSGRNFKGRQHESEERRGAGVAKGVRQGLYHEFYRAREEEGVATGANWPSMAMAAGPALMAFKEAREGEGEVTEGG
jgi:hypothetical protein